MGTPRSLDTMSEKPKSAVIVGAGAGGVALAARLAKAGLRVTVVEKNSFTGGRCSLIHHEGYRFDQGPSLFLLPHLCRPRHDHARGRCRPAALRDKLQCLVPRWRAL